MRIIIIIYKQYLLPLYLLLLLTINKQKYFELKTFGLSFNYSVVLTYKV